MCAYAHPSECSSQPAQRSDKTESGEEEMEKNALDKERLQHHRAGTTATDAPASGVRESTNFGTPDPTEAVVDKENIGGSLVRNDSPPQSIRVHFQCDGKYL